MKGEKSMISKVYIGCEFFVIYADMECCQSKL
jgi:hypothetical protein